MTEKQLISKIKELKQIKPREDWVFLTKQRILGLGNEELEDKEIDRSLSFVYYLSDIIKRLKFVSAHKFAFASVGVLVIVLFGIFGFAQNSLPGDSLYSIKKITEKSQVIFVSEKELPKKNLELANKRLDDLTKIAQTKSVRNLAPAIKEYKASVTEAAKSLVEKEPELKEIKEIALEVKKLEENTKKIESLGVVIEEEKEELNDALSQLVKREIKKLEKEQLTEEQSKVLEEIKQAYQAGKFSQALEKILFFTNDSQSDSRSTKKE